MLRAHQQKGNVLTVLLSAVVLAGVLSFTVYHVMSGPLASAVRVSNKISADDQILSVSRSIITASVDQANSGDCDSDGSVEPPVWVTTAGNKPTNGGLLPTTLGLQLTDPWGSNYGYCVWDVGTSIKAAGCGGAGANRRSGSPTPTAGSVLTQTVLAVISSGPDRVFSTTCNNYVDATTDLITTSGDDIVRRYTYTDAAQATESLWSLKVAVPGTATITKNLEIGDNATVGSVSALALSSIGQVTAGGGIKIGNQTVVTGCAAGDVGLMRYEAVSKKLELCYDNAWSEILGSGGGSINQLSDGITDYATLYNVFLGKNSGSSATTGARNTGTGVDALKSLTTGDDNTALGNSALGLLTSIPQNTAAGVQALANLNGGGGYNTALGYQSFFQTHGVHTTFRRVCSRYLWMAPARKTLPSAFRRKTQ